MINFENNEENMLVTDILSFFHITLLNTFGSCQLLLVEAP